MKKDINNSDLDTRNFLSGLDFLLILSWLIVGTILRFTNLADKSASSIEIATIGFSLGHGFNHIPIDRIIPLSSLLSPLRLDTTITAADVVARLFDESTHPPLYFWLTHWWIELFSDNGEIVSLAVVRSLSAIFGGLSIPAIFALSWVSFRSRFTAHLSSILMAVSPYGIYLAQEARHYTLSILWIIASLTCLMLTIEHINRRTKLPWRIALVWIVINSLGIATHYFFGLALVIQALILLSLWLRDYCESKQQISLNYWWRIGLVVLATFVTCLVWLPIVSGISSNELTDWIATEYDLDLILQPILRLFGWLITMVILLPIEGTPVLIRIISGLIVLLGLIWITPLLIRGWKLLISSYHLPGVIFTSYLVGAIVLYLSIIYGYGKDLSLAARYHFIYFPVVIVLLAAILVQLWQNYSVKDAPSKFYAGGKKVTTIVVVMGLLGSLTVVNNLGYQKSRQSNSLTEHIIGKITVGVPTIVATSYTSHSPLRELVALALSFETNPNSETTPQFLLLNQDDQNYVRFRDIVLSHSKPLDIWSVNLKINPVFLTYDLHCIGDIHSDLPNSGYKNLLYHCR